MAPDTARTVRLAAVQMVSHNGQVDKNLDHAVQFIDEAAQQRAELIILPEFMPTGYIFSTDIWDAGEPTQGPTVNWLKEHAKRLGIYLGTSFLEADGEDFFNTFVLTTPEGDEAGRVRKQTPAVFEAYFTKGAPGPHVIDTKIGKIGVGICYENQLSYTPHLMFSQSVDLFLMPHSAPSPAPGPLLPKRMIDNIYNENLKSLTTHYSNLLGVPAVMINKSGQWHSPLPGLPFLTQRSSFPGLSAIADSDGTLKAQLGGEERVIVADVLLDPSRKTNVQPSCRGRWSKDIPRVANIFRVIEFVGGIWYTLSRERKQRAREISSSYYALK